MAISQKFSEFADVLATKMAVNNNQAFVVMHDNALVMQYHYL